MVHLGSMAVHLLLHLNLLVHSQNDPSSKGLQEFIAISLGYEDENEIIKVIPMDINSEIVTCSFKNNTTCNT